MSIFKRLQQVFKPQSNTSKEVRLVPQPEQTEVEFDVLPEGKYLARFISEEINAGSYILAVFEITEGSSKGKRIPQLFDSKIAKEISRDYTGSWLSRLAFEGNKKAQALEEALLNSDGEFIVTLRDGHVTSVPEPDYDQMERLRKKLNRAS